jgi:hypothetical protein
MRWIKAMSATVMVVLAGMAVGITRGADTTRPVAPLTWATTMPAIELSNRPLEQVLNELKQKLPGFDFSISRENVPHEYPVLPEMRVENVSLDDFEKLLQGQVPGISFSQTPDNGAVAWNSQPFFEIHITPNPNLPVPGVHVFGLTDIIAYRASLLKGDGDHDKQAMNDVLSLIQAALDETDSPVKPQMKIHAPTQTLICKITSEQAEVVQQVLASLKPTEAQLRQLEEMQQHSVLAEVEKINKEAATREAGPQKP